MIDPIDWVMDEETRREVLASGLGVNRLIELHVMEAMRFAGLALDDASDPIAESLLLELVGRLQTASGYVPTN